MLVQWRRGDCDDGGDGRAVGSACYAAPAERITRSLRGYVDFVRVAACRGRADALLEPRRSIGKSVGRSVGRAPFSASYFRHQRESAVGQKTSSIQREFSAASLKRKCVELGESYNVEVYPSPRKIKERAFRGSIRRSPRGITRDYKGTWRACARERERERESGPSSTRVAVLYLELGFQLRHGGIRPDQT